MAAQRHLISDLARGCPAHACLPSLRASLGYRSVAAVQLVVPDRPRNSWVVIPFHPVWFNAGLGGIGKSLLVRGDHSSRMSCSSLASMIILLPTLFVLVYRGPSVVDILTSQSRLGDVHAIFRGVGRG